MDADRQAASRAGAVRPEDDHGRPGFDLEQELVYNSMQSIGRALAPASRAPTVHARAG